MTSELRVDNLKGSTTGGSINVLGEGTSATTNLQQGLAKAFILANQITASDSFNCSGTTDHGTGDYTFTLTNGFSSPNWVLSHEAGHSGTTYGFYLEEHSTGRSSNSHRFNTFGIGDSAQDADLIQQAFFGDLA